MNDTLTIAVRYKGAVRAVRVRCADCPAFECFEPARRVIRRTREELFTCDVRVQHGCPQTPERKGRPDFVLDGNGVWVRVPGTEPYRPQVRPIA